MCSSDLDEISKTKNRLLVAADQFFPGRRAVSSRPSHKLGIGGGVALARRLE